MSSVNPYILLIYIANVWPPCISRLVSAALGHLCTYFQFQNMDTDGDIQYVILLTGQAAGTLRGHLNF